MIDCSPCKNLAGRSAKESPHAGLKADQRLKQTGGNIERYECLKCGAKWSRFVTNQSFGAKPSFWLRSR